MNTPKGRVEKRAPVGLACVLEHSPDMWKRANLHADGNTRRQVISALLAKINQNNRLLMAEQIIGLMEPCIPVGSTDQWAPCRKLLNLVLRGLELTIFQSDRDIYIPNCDTRGFYRKKQGKCCA
ncbi:hypothetical protein JOQ06_006659 [Pogonophryne albipinna]|uniref:Thyroglobulin type-1 domain-containing protein n=1 Tax=Pogonophryne albipinna TaxID=1090488 RepID=A0AAD6FG32_9TELE|nr:hypothetical protein JOQ06_006659 [Pogonophryne albipinna]